MPTISRFLGIVIAMYWDDHAPPHFHAKYGEYEITVNINTGVVEDKFLKSLSIMCLNGIVLDFDTDPTFSRFGFSLKR